MDNLVILKGVILFIGTLISVFGISYLIYMVFNRFEKQKTGKRVGFGVFFTLIIFTLYIMFGFPFLMYKQFSFFESTAIEELKEVNLQLYNDFQVLDYETSGLSFDSHTFRLKIAKKEVRRLIENEEISDDTVIIRFKEITPIVTVKVIIDTKSNILIYRYGTD